MWLVRHAISGEKDVMMQKTVVAFAKVTAFENCC